MIFPSLLRRLRSVRPDTRQSSSALPPEIETIRQRALQGYVLEQVQWGDILLDSVHVQADPGQARHWYDVAARAGFAPAENMLGRCAQFGWGCAIDLSQAALHYRRAGEGGDRWGHYNLGILMMRGLGMPADRAGALARFRVAAAAGHAKSMNLIARFTEEGWETPRDPLAAREWYRRSAEGGDYRGQHNYATILLAQGERAGALGWWRRAAVNATSDILLAIEKRLATLGEAGDLALLADIRQKLLSQPRPVHATRLPGQEPATAP